MNPTHDDNGNTERAIARGEQDARDHARRGERQRLFARAMTPMQRECLIQLVERGPVWDGDICSKQARGELFDMGLADRAIVKGQQGYSAANYLGFETYQALKGL